MPLTSGVACLLDSAATIQWQVVDHQEVLTVTFYVELLCCNANTSVMTSEKAYVHVHKHLHIWSDKIPECPRSKFDRLTWDWLGWRGQAMSESMFPWIL